MRREVMLAMSGDELDRYALLIGANVSGMKTVAEKVAAIESKREGTHEVTLLGAVFSVPARNIRDKRFQDAARTIDSDDDAELAARLVLGDEQFEELVERATDEDGVVDVDALGMAVVCILTNPELKNY